MTRAVACFNVVEARGICSRPCPPRPHSQNPQLPGQTTIRSFFGTPSSTAASREIGLREEREREREARGLEGTFDILVCFSSSRHDGRDAIIIQRDEGHEARPTFLASFSSSSSSTSLSLLLLLLLLLAIPSSTRLSSLTTAFHCHSIGH